MGFGFVIVKFALFLKQLSLLLESNVVAAQEYSALVGVIMVAVGVMIAVFAFLQYKINSKHLQNNYYAPRSVLSLIITLIMIVGGIILIVYLLSTL